MSLVLAIDTAAPRLQLALLRADGSVDLSVDELAQGHAELLFARLATLLERNGTTYADLTRIAVTTGPGSFTGVRIGLSAARGFGLALNIPVLGVPSLIAISLAAPQDAPVAVLLDARRQEAYFQTFATPGIAVSEPCILPMAEALDLVPAGATLMSSPFVDIGRLVRYAATAQPAAFPPEASYVRDADAKPQLRARVARLGAA